MMPNFGFAPGILDYWTLLTDWRNGSFAILLVLSVLLVGCALRPVEGADQSAPWGSTPGEKRPPAPSMRRERDQRIRKKA
jgi:hypothetical protein